MTINMLCDVPGDASAIVCGRCRTVQSVAPDAPDLGLTVDPNVEHASPVVVCNNCERHGGFFAARVATPGRLPDALSQAWAPTPHALWDHGEALNLTAHDRLVVLAIWRRQSGSADAWPSQADIAHLAGLSLAAVKRSIRDLRERGLLDVQAHYGEQGRSTNRYDVRPLWSALAAIEHGLTVEIAT